jgi:plastocyanin
VSWMAVLLAATMAAVPGHHRVVKHGRLAKKAPVHRGMKVTRPAPGPGSGAHPPVEPAPTPGPSATPAPTPAPLPSRTRVVLDDDPYKVQSAYLTMQAGPLEFNVVNVGMDDHNLSIKGRADTEFVPAGGESRLEVTLPAGTYRLYCSLPGHEAAGMWTTVVVR